MDTDDPSVRCGAPLPAHTGILPAVRHALLNFLQMVAVLLVGVLTYGLTFLLTASGPWTYRAVAGLAAAGAVYFGAIRARPRPWLAEQTVEAGSVMPAQDKRRRRTRTGP